MKAKTTGNNVRVPALGLAAVVLFVGSAVACASGEVSYVAGKERSRTDTIAVPQMQCGMCEERITSALGRIAGVSKVSANADMKHVVVTYDPRKITLVTIEKRIAAVGYDAGRAHTTAAAQNSLSMCCRPGGGH